MSFIIKRSLLLVAAAFFALTIFSTAASASNEALTDLLKVLVDRGTITADEYSILKRAAAGDHEKSSTVTFEKMAGVEKKLAKAEKSTKKTLPKIKWTEKVKVKGDIRSRCYCQANIQLGSGSRICFR